MERIYIDNNIWDQLYTRNVDLNAHFPRNKYELCVTQHGVYEGKQIPNTNDQLKAYIERFTGSIVQTDAIFGFENPNLPSSEQRVDGFGVGRFTDIKEDEMRRHLSSKYSGRKKRKDTQILFPQEADIELGAMSVHNIVITLDVKNGPLTCAKSNGGKVIFLNKSKIEGLNADDFVDYIKNEIFAFNNEVGST